MAVNTFGVWDYVVCGFMLLVSAGIGVFFGCTGGKQRSTQEFLMANRQMSTFPVALSLLATFTSALSILGIPSEIYTFGTSYCIMGLSYPLMCIFVGNVMVPVFFRLKLTSIFEYLEMRFHRSVRIISAVLFMFQMLLYMAVVLYGPALALNVVAGLNIWLSVCLVGLVCTFYTTIGGMKAVLWTDVFQVIMMFSGLLAVLIQGSINNNGFTNIWRKNEEGQRIDFLNFDPDPTVRHTWWTLVVGGFFYWTTLFGANQSSVQRALTLPNERQVKWAYWGNTISLLGILALTTLCGMVLFATYGHCDPLLRGDIIASDQLFPLFVLDNLSILPGLPGLFLSCVFSSSLSTVSSGLNSLAAVTLRDFILPCCGDKLSDQRATNITKFIAVFFGFLSLGFSYLASQFGAILTAGISILGIVGGPTLGVFVLGMLFPCANGPGGLFGLLGGLTVSLWIGIGTRVYRPFIPKPPVFLDECPIDNSTNVLFNMTTSMTGEQDMFNTTTASTSMDHGPRTVYHLSYLYYSLVSSLAVVIVGLIVSAITACKERKPVDARLIAPICDICCCYLPKGWREKLHCDVDHSKKHDEGLAVEGDDDTEKGTTMAGIENILQQGEDNDDKSPPATVDGVAVEMPPSYQDPTGDETRANKGEMEDTKL